MTVEGEAYNRINEFREVEATLKLLQELLHKHGIHYVFAACLAQNHPTDGRDMVAFVSNTGQPNLVDYQNVTLIHLLQLVQGQGVFVPPNPNLSRGVYVPVVIPANPKSN
jgi:hypothetical protein